MMKTEYLPYYAIALAILIAGLVWVGMPLNTILAGLVVLACPLMMIFMMSGHGDHDDHHRGERREQPRDTTRHPRT